MGNEIRVQDGIRTNVSAGGELLRNEGSTYGAGTLGVEVNIPIGKKFTIDPQLSGKLGKDVKGIGFQLGTTTQVNSKLGINAGVGLRQTSFSGSVIQDESIYSNGKFTPMEGEEGLMQTGDFSEQGSISSRLDTRRSNTEGYAFAGVKYNVTPQLSLAAGGEIGYKHSDLGQKRKTITFEGERCVRGAELKYEELADGYGTYVWDGEPVIEKYSGQISAETNSYKNNIVGGITAGAEYGINKNLAVGVDGKIGIGNSADSRVGLNLKVKF